MPVAKPLAHCELGVQVIRNEEKGSDVNLAAFMLLDGFRDLYDTAIVVSDDSDLLHAMRIVRDELGKEIAVVRVRGNRASVFRNEPGFKVYDGAREAYFRRSQLPDPAPDCGRNNVSKPARWA
jgi:hypothetical protein